MFRLTQYMHQILNPTPARRRSGPVKPVVIWNLTRSCNLKCRHCYTVSADRPFPGELSHDQAMSVLRDLSDFRIPALILSGGEPLLRPDIFAIGARAKALLRDSRDVLTAAHETGLSGPSRLHDLLIACDAVTPGEVRAWGAGLEITYGYGQTPFGPVLAGTTPRGLCHLQFIDDQASAFDTLRDDWPLARLTREDAALAGTIKSLFAEEPGAQPLHLLLRGTNFQIKVWEALLKIPPGDVVSYQTLARLTGNPRAQRAVGTALAHNRIALLIPCHRVIRESGDVGQYRWGSERKSALLAYETSAAAHH